jgi:hypothetical protein
MFSDNAPPEGDVDVNVNVMDELNKLFRAGLASMTMDSEAKKRAQEKAKKIATLKGCVGNYVITLPGARHYVLALRLLEDEGEDADAEPFVIVRLTSDEKHPKKYEGSNVEFNANTIGKVNTSTLKFQAEIGFFLSITLVFSANGIVTGSSSGGTLTGPIVGSRV